MWLRKQPGQCIIPERIVARIQPATRRMSPDRRDWPQFGVRPLRDFELIVTDAKNKVCFARHDDDPSVTNGGADNTSGTSEVPQLADPFCAARKSAEAGQPTRSPRRRACRIVGTESPLAVSYRCRLGLGALEDAPWRGEATLAWECGAASPIGRLGCAT